VVTPLEVPPAAVRAAAGLLSDAERLRAARFVFGRDRRRFIVARARLRELLGARLGVPPKTVEFAYGRHGKPSLGPRFAEADLRFNVSHCDELAVYALVSGQEVGIDVEAVRVHEDADDMATLMFSPREIASYRTLPTPDKPLAFVNCWTRKEALVKALGGGLTVPLRNFDVTLAPGEPAAIRRAPEGDWSLSAFSPAPGFVAAVVVGGVDE
jgi:4'-phosphopantetheinyl transferase